MPDILDRLSEMIADRLRTGDPATSYVAMRAAQGRRKMAQKLGEEAVETVVAAVAEDDQALIGEAADLLFHLLIVLADRGISLDAVRAELQRREGRSGIAEKKSRKL